MYYLRTRPAVDAIQFTVDKGALAKENDEKKAKEDEMERQMAQLVCSLENKDECLMCSG